MSNDEQFVAHLRALESAPPASTVDAHRVLAAGRRRRVARGTGIAALSLAVVTGLYTGVAAFPDAFGPVRPASSPSPFDGWTADPTMVFGSASASLGERCLDTMNQAAQEGDLGVLPPDAPVGARPLFAEDVGQATFSVVGGDLWGAACLASDSGGLDASFYPQPSAPLTPDGAVVATYRNISGSSVVYVVGRVGPTVSEIRIQPSEGQGIAATVADGYFAASWRGDADTPIDLRVISNDGTVTDMTLTDDPAEGLAPESTGASE
jgi:hypothetical protein